MPPFIGMAMLLGILGGISIDTAQRTIGAPIHYAQAEEPPKVILIEAQIDWTKERINQEIESKAKEYGVSDKVMKKVIECESQGSTTIQSYHIDSDGTREDSWGLVQINLPHNPNVSREEAIDPEYAIDFLANGLSKGLGKRWTCWRMHYQ